MVIMYAILPMDFLLYLIELKDLAAAFQIGTLIAFLLLSTVVSLVLSRRKRALAYGLLLLSALFIWVNTNLFTLIFLLTYMAVFRYLFSRGVSLYVLISVILAFSLLYKAAVYIPHMEHIGTYTTFGAIGLGVIMLRLLDMTVNRRNTRTIVGFFLYCLFFPAFLMGPIEKAELFEIRMPNLREGGKRILLSLTAGLSYLVLSYAWNILSVDTDGLFIMIKVVYLGLVFLTVLYFYFSLVTGFSYLMGIYLPDNFPKNPYLAPSISEFWRRWNATVMRALRDIVYIPMGGRDRRTLAVFATFTVSALWHVYMYIEPGTVYSIYWFGVWGLYSFVVFFVLDQMERRFHVSKSTAGRYIMPVVITLMASIGWMFFGQAPTAYLGL